MAWYFLRCMQNQYIHMGQLGNCLGHRPLRVTGIPLSSPHSSSKQGAEREAFLWGEATQPSRACCFEPFPMPAATACLASEAASTVKEPLLGFVAICCTETAQPTSTCRSSGPSLPAASSHQASKVTHPGNSFPTLAISFGLWVAEKGGRGPKDLQQKVLVSCSVSMWREATWPSGTFCCILKQHPAALLEAKATQTLILVVVPCKPQESIFPVRAPSPLTVHWRGGFSSPVQTEGKWCLSPLPRIPCIGCSYRGIERKESPAALFSASVPEGSLLGLCSRARAEKCFCCCPALLACHFGYTCKFIQSKGTWWWQ